LLQQRGHETIGAGNALAVQNFAENIAMLLFVAVYGWALAAGVTVIMSVAGFGLTLLAGIAVLAALRMKKS
ncbi:MAG TPA: MFS transporter, partial [Gallionella sp.]